MYGIAKLWEDLRSIKKEVAKTQKGDLFTKETLKAELEEMKKTIQLDVESYQVKLSKIITNRKFAYQKRAAKVCHRINELMAIRHEVFKLEELIEKSP